MPDQNVDNLMKAIGNPGKYQVLIFALTSINFMIMLSTHFTMIFFAAKTEHHCSVATGRNISDIIPTITSNGEQKLDGCNLYQNGNKTQTIPCNNGWTYYMEEREQTIISEFDLVCDNAYKADLATTIYFCGVTLGGIFFGVLADRFGRWPIIAITLLAAGIIGIAIFIFRTYIAFVVLRFCLGLVIQGLQSSSVVLSMELFSAKYRGHVGVLCGVTGNIGALCFALLVYVVRDWKYIQLVLSIVSLVQLVSLWIIPESIRWHLLHGRFKKAETTIRKIVKVNKLPYPEDLFEKVKLQSAKEIACPNTKQNVNLLDLYRSSSLRKVTIILSIVLFSISVTFFGLSFNISFLFGNKYLNFAVGQVIDVLCISSLLWTVPRFGRRKPLVSTIFISAVTIAICAVIASLNTERKHANIIRTVAALGGKAFSSSAIVVMILFTAELYPTILRNIGFGVNMFWSRVGAMIAPQIFFLGYKTSTLIPYAIVGTLVIVSGILVLMLPETRKRILLDRLRSETTCEKNDEQQNIINDDPVEESPL